MAGTGAPGNEGGDARRGSQSSHSARITIKNEGREDTDRVQSRGRERVKVTG